MNPPRRRLLGALFGGLPFAPAVLFARAARSQPPPPRVEDTATPEEIWIARAFELQRRARQSGDQPYGALLVRDGRLLGESPSRVILERDPTAHAEMLAIRDAARRLGSGDLSGCVMYSSSRPCPMCEAAAYWAGISRLVWGRTATDGGRPRLCG
ncbi:MAG: nucleoside deaminase [Burkholderiales bacterium]|nr:nucleoside deaminase [Burkholderiales bacterium]